MTDPTVEFSVNLEMNRHDDRGNDITEDRLKDIITKALRAHGFSLEWVAVDAYYYEA